MLNYGNHSNGRIWVFWNPEVLDVSEVLVIDQLIHVEVTIIQKQTKIMVSFVYDLHSRSQQAELWQSISHLSGLVGRVPWILLGDFNMVRKPKEREGGNLSWFDALEDCDRCCSENLLEDLRYTGHHLTWGKGEGANFLARKLDRVLVNHLWLEEFEEAEACFLVSWSLGPFSCGGPAGSSFALQKVSFQVLQFMGL